jgi:hypothetical protein
MIQCQLSFDCSGIKSLLPQLESQPAKCRQILSMLEAGRSKELFACVVDADQSTPHHVIFKFVPTDLLALMLVSVDC